MQSFTVDEHYVQNHRKRTTAHNDSDSEQMDDDTYLSSGGSCSGSGSGSGSGSNQMDDLMFPVESITPSVTPPMSATKAPTPTIHTSGGYPKQSFNLNNTSFGANPPIISASFPKSIPLNFSEGSPSFSSSSHGHARKGRRLFFEDTTSPSLVSANNNNSSHNNNNNNSGTVTSMAEEPVFKVPGSSARMLNFSAGSSSSGSSNNSSTCSSNSNSGNYSQYQHTRSSSSSAMVHPFSLSNQQASQPKAFHQHTINGGSPSSPLLSSSLPTSPVSWSFNDHVSPVPPSSNKSFTFSYGETKSRIKPDQKAFNYDSLSNSPSPSPPPTPTPKSVNRQLEKSRAILSNSIKPYDPTDPLDYIQASNNNSNNTNNINSSSSSNSNPHGIVINTHIGHIKRQRSTSMSSPINTPTNINPFLSSENFQFMLPKKTNRPNNSLVNSINNNNIDSNNSINNSINNSFDDIENNSHNTSVDNVNSINSSIDIDNDNDNDNNNNNNNSNSLYNMTFDQINLIGEGSFGLVYKCRHRTDGCLYAVKKTKKQMKGSKSRSFVMREVFGLSAIRDHSNIVRYYNAWEEDYHIFIQMEFCGGGNLYHWISKHLVQSEAILLEVAKQVLNGLIHIHSLGLVHLDVKPENIYIQKAYSNGANNKQSNLNNHNNCNCNHNNHVNCNSNNNNHNVIYKLGDLGLMNEATDNNYFSEGDSRYVSRELLLDDMRALKKSDIFSLGCTLYELARCRPLPKSGPEWNAIRDGKLNETKDFSAEFWQLLRFMINPITDLRPTAEELYSHVNEMLNTIKLQQQQQHQSLQTLFSNHNNNNNEEIERLKLIIQQQSQMLVDAQNKIREQQKIIDFGVVNYTNQFHKVEGDLKKMAL